MKLLPCVVFLALEKLREESVIRMDANFTSLLFVAGPCM